MSHADFVHLRVHTAYSLSEGAIRMEELPALCMGEGEGQAPMPAVAITDTNNLFGALEFSTKMAKEGIQPIIGCVLSIREEADEENGHNGKRPDPAALVLLVQNEDGYRNLLKLVSKAHLETEPGEKAQVSIDDLSRHHAGLIALSGGPDGPVGRLLQAARNKEAEALTRRLAEIFADRFYIEIQRHGMDEEFVTEPHFLKLAYDLDIPLVATNDCFFADEAMFEAHDALLCIAHGNYIAQTDRARLTPDHRFKSAAEMKFQFRNLPEAIGNTVVIAQRCAYKVPLHDPILPKFPTEAGRSEADELRARAEAGLEERLADHVFTGSMTGAEKETAATPYRERLAHELEIISRMDYPGYFLIVSDFIKWAKDNAVPVGPGRGSGAGSVVAWALTITDLDPLRFGLLFERFLNPERVSMPDFDIDFCQEKRDRVIHYVQDKYGHDQVAQIITFGKLQARAVMRDVGRVLQMPYGHVDRLCKMVPNNPANPVTLAEAIEGEPRLQHERDTDETVERMLSIALKLEGLYRHASTHAAGVVIGDRPLEELVPLYRDPRSDIPATQFNMKWVEQAGLVKFDFLGLKTLTVIDKARQMLAGRGIDVDPSTLALDDPATYELLGAGETVGVFQLESSGMRDVLRKVKPDVFEDIIALVALYRPGPMDNIDSFVKRKHGEETPDYLHESLEPILKETYGVIIYQEQVMQIAQVLAGYSLGEADLLRRAMGKKIAAEMDAQRERFVTGAVERGVEKSRASFIFDLVAKFAGYGFNKSHAAAYAKVAYETAWLKANHPVEFLAASMTLDQGNTDKLNHFRRELARMDIPLLPPDINRSEVDFSVSPVKENGGENLGVRYALAAIKNVGHQAMESVVAERAENGPFADIFDFVRRIDPRHVNRRQLENLIKAGAFDGLHENRAQLFAAIDQLVRESQVAAEERDSQQTSLFGGDDAEYSRPVLPATEDWGSMDRLNHEFAAIGFFLSGHPLDSYRSALKQQKIVTSSAIVDELRRGRSGFRVAGIVSSVKEKKSQKGRPYAFVELTDADGSYEVMFFQEALSKHRQLLEESQPVVVSVEGQLDGDSARLTAQRVQLVDEIAAQAGTGLEIFVAEQDAFEDIESILARHRGNKGVVTLKLAANDGRREVEIELGERYTISSSVRDAVAAVPGVIDAREIE